jgi:hypothetical protein
MMDRYDRLNALRAAESFRDEYLKSLREEAALVWAGLDNDPDFSHYVFSLRAIYHQMVYCVFIPGDRTD